MWTKDTAPCLTMLPGNVELVKKASQARKQLFNTQQQQHFFFLFIIFFFKTKSSFL